ncbi:hypothetical protein UP10_10235 [Bradyrhizobium sp. LTSPM299]|nr:hypothetical protein UP10_10235 [Bradyrhizobium sp. LTSPM299]
MENDEAVGAGTSRRNLPCAQIRADRLEGCRCGVAFTGGGRSTAGANGGSARGGRAASGGAFDGRSGVVAGPLDSRPRVVGGAFDSRSGVVGGTLDSRPSVVGAALDRRHGLVAGSLDRMPDLMAGILVGFRSPGRLFQRLDFQRSACGGIKSTFGVSAARKNKRNR